MKTVFVVKGSEDGLLGVYTTKKLASERALEYVNRQTDVHMLADDFSTKIKASYVNLCRELKKHWTAHIYSNYAEVSIEKVILNR